METRKPHHHGDLRNAAIAFAVEAARLGTIETMSLREMSRALGVSPGAVYRHFADKDALLRAVAGFGFDLLAERFEAAMPFAFEVKTPEQARQRFHALALAYTEFARAHYGLWRLMFGPLGLIQPEQPAHRPHGYQWLSKAIGDLANQGCIAQANADAERFAWSAIHGLSDLAASPAIDIECTEAAVASHCNMMLGALRAA